MPQDSVRSEPVAEWRAAFGGCRSILEALAKASDDDGRAAARMWWVACMGAQLNACRSKHNEWKEQAAAELPKQLQAEHTERAVMLPGFEPLAQCILDRGAAIGVNPAVTLDHVENEGGRQFAASDWKRAVGEVEPLRRNLQLGFLRRANEQGFLRRSIRRASDGGKGQVSLAPSAAEMDVDELRVCQVWMYGLASRLTACHRAASEFAIAAGMVDPNSPLKGYDEERWDPTEPPWQRMEICVHTQANKAGTEADAAWRPKF